jgi:hypothetical protein
MLEKIADIALVNKLRAILLMEADFNMHNRIIFGNRMIHKAREEGLIPPEIFSTEGATAEDGSFGKGLVTDISRQSRINMAITSNDAESCYNRIAHAMLSLILQAMTVGKGAITAMLIPIQIMCFFLRTGFGESKTSMGGNPNSRTQGLCQGNTASPAGWEILCATMLRCHQRRGHGALLVSPMSLSVTQLMGIWFVDDCDLITMAPYCPGEAVWDEAQEALDSWASLLTLTGGALKGDKCFWYPIEYVWHDDGSWSYSSDVDSELSIPLINGKRETVAKLGVHESRKTLGVYACPSGRSTAHIQYINDRACRWTCKLLNSALPAKWAWVSYSMQLWPSLRYGLGTLSASLARSSALQCRNSPSPSFQSWV